MSNSTGIDWNPKKRELFAKEILRHEQTYYRLPRGTMKKILEGLRKRHPRLFPKETTVRALQHERTLLRRTHDYLYEVIIAKYPDSFDPKTYAVTLTDRRWNQLFVNSELATDRRSINRIKKNDCCQALKLLKNTMMGGRYVHIPPADTDVEPEVIEVSDSDDEKEIEISSQQKRKRKFLFQNKSSGESEDERDQRESVRSGSASGKRLRKNQSRISDSESEESAFNEEEEEEIPRVPGLIITDDESEESAFEEEHRQAKECSHPIRLLSNAPNVFESDSESESEIEFHKESHSESEDESTPEPRSISSDVSGFGSEPESKPTSQSDQSFTSAHVKEEAPLTLPSESQKKAKKLIFKLSSPKSSPARQSRLPVHPQPPQQRSLHLQLQHHAPYQQYSPLQPEYSHSYQASHLDQNPFPYPQQIASNWSGPPPLPPHLRRIPAPRPLRGRTSPSTFTNATSVYRPPTPPSSKSTSRFKTQPEVDAFSLLWTKLIGLHARKVTVDTFQITDEILDKVALEAKKDDLECLFSKSCLDDRRFLLMIQRWANKE